MTDGSHMTGLTRRLKYVADWDLPLGFSTPPLLPPFSSLWVYCKFVPEVTLVTLLITKESGCSLSCWSWGKFTLYRISIIRMVKHPSMSVWNDVLGFAPARCLTLL
jgi:hypothetical protein